MPINIYWIRHGYSCANIHKKIHAIIHDPSLTYDGLECSIRSSEFVPKIKWDYVLCSSLKRAMETALAMFPNQNIISVPFIGEKGFGFDNSRSDFKNIKYYFSDFKNLDLEYHNPDNKCYHKDTGPDITKFFEFLDSQLLPNYKNKSINIAIVTHSHFMVHNKISEGKKKPNNNSIFKVKYTGLIQNMDHMHKFTITKRNITKIYDGCIFNKKKQNYKLECHKTCEKKPIETSKNYIRCPTITQRMTKKKKYLSLNNNSLSRKITGKKMYHYL